MIISKIIDGLYSIFIYSLYEKSLDNYLLANYKKLLSSI